MGVVIRQSFWSSVLVYSGILLGYLNSLYLLPKYFDVEQIGLIRLIQSNGLMLVPFALLGMQGSYTKLFPKVNHSKKLKNQLFSLHVFIILLAGAFFISIALLAKDWIILIFEEKSSEYNQYLFISIIIFIAQSFFQYFQNFCKSELNITFPDFLQEIFLRFLLTLLILLFGFGYLSFGNTVLILGISYTLSTFILLVYIHIRYKIEFDASFLKIEREILRENFKFGGFVFSQSLGTSIMTNISYVVTTSYIGLTANGILVINQFIGRIIGLPKKTVSQITSPLISLHFKNNDFKSIETLYKRSSINLSTVSVLLMIGITTNIQDLYLIIPQGETFREGFYLVILICVAQLLSMSTSINNEILTYSGHYKWNYILLVIRAISITAFSFIFIPKYGVTGAGLATLLNSGISQGILTFIVRFKFGILPFTVNHVKLAIIATIVFLSAYNVTMEFSPLVNIIIRSISTTLTFSLLIYFWNVSYEINNIVDKVLNRFAQIFK